MIYRNKDGTIYKVEAEFSDTAIPVLPSNHEMKSLEDKVDGIKKAVLELEEVVNYLIWRQSECFRNFNNAWCQYLLSKKGLTQKEVSKKLKDLKTKELRDLINKNYGLKKIPVWQERGVLLYKKLYKKKGYDPIKKKSVVVDRFKTVVDFECHDFSKNQELINEIIEKGFI